MTDKAYSLTSRTVLGIAVLLLGILLTLDNFDYIDAASILRYWPVLLLVFGGIRAVQPGSAGGRLTGGVVALLGALMLLERGGLLHMNLWSLWPLLLVALGASLILRTRPRIARGAAPEDTVTGTAVLGGMEQRCNAQAFRGGSVSAILGGHEIDLRDADMPENSEATLDVFALMGGIELRVPAQWQVIAEGHALLGGFENRTRSDPSSTRRLRITGQAIMGGVEIGN